MTEVAEKAPDLYEAAALAFEVSDKLASDAAYTSFASQLHRKIKVKREDVEVNPDYFDDPVAHLRIGAVKDGVLLCLDKSRALAAVVWHCAEKDCPAIYRAPFDDLVSLGRVLALGDQEQIRQPKCDKHRPRLGR